MQEVKLGVIWGAELMPTIKVGHALSIYPFVLQTCARSQIRGVLGFGDGYNSFRLGTPPQIQECKFSHGIFIYFSNEKYSFRSKIDHALMEDDLFV